MVERRVISENELAVLTAWLDHDVPGAVELRSQLTPTLEVYRSCDCGCGSIGFARPQERQASTSGVNFFAVQAVILDEDGATVGGMALLSKGDGLLHDVDLHWDAEGTQSFPLLDQVRFEPPI